MKKVGLITIGESPRTDIMVDMEPILADNFEILQGGALDGLSKEELEALKPEGSDIILVSTLRNGQSIIMAERKILKYMQQRIDELESKGADIIMLLCTGNFDDTLHSNVPLIYPNKIIEGLLSRICDDGLIAVTPDNEQMDECKKYWQDHGVDACMASISPYDNSLEDFVEFGKTLNDYKPAYILLDCMGFSAKMKEALSTHSEKKIVLPRTMLASILKELL